MPKIFVTRSPRKREDQPAARADIGDELSIGTKIEIYSPCRADLVSLFVRAQKSGGHCAAGTRLSARCEQRFQGRYPSLHGMEAVAFFSLIDLEAAVVVVDVIFVGPVEPEASSHVTRNPEPHTNIALALEREAVLQYRPVKRRDWVQSLTHENLVNECVPIAEQE